VVARLARTEQVQETRGLIMAAAERLFAEYGIAAVSNRQISEAAGQGNNAAVNYHFGTKTDLLRAIVSQHASQIEQRREVMLRGYGDSPHLRDWVSCLVRPKTDHLASLGVPSWYARFVAQLMTDPALRGIVVSDALTERPLRQTIDGLNRRLPPLPAPVRADRTEMASQLIVGACAAYERAMAAGTAGPRSSWPRKANGLIDAIVGLLTAPVGPA
jgi:AcrR family transcriptional regulator